MSIILTDNFNSGVFDPTQWTSIIVGCVPYWGVDRTYCAGCSVGVASAYKIFGSSYTQSAFRTQATAIVASLGTIPEGRFFCEWNDQTAVTLDNFQALVYLRGDGSFRVRWNDGDGHPPGVTNTAPGLWPTGGTQFGLQVRLTITDTTHATVVFTINDVDVATVTHSPVTPWEHATWNEFFLYTTRTPTGLPSGSPPLTELTLFDNVEVDTSNAAVTWLNGNGLPINLNVTCFGPPPVVTYMERRVRIFALPFNQSFWLYLRRIEFLIQAGVGLSSPSAQGYNPVMQVAFSPDGGNTWGPWIQLALGQQGQYDLRAAIDAVGALRNGQCQVVLSDPVLAYLLDCYVDGDWNLT